MPCEWALLALTIVIHCSVSMPLTFRVDISNQYRKCLVDSILRFHNTVLQVIPPNVLVFTTGAMSFVSSTIYCQNTFMNLGLICLEKLLHL